MCPKKRLEEIWLSSFHSLNCKNLPESGNWQVCAVCWQLYVTLKDPQQMFQDFRAASTLSGILLD